MTVERTVAAVLCAALGAVPPTDTCRGPASGEPDGPQVEFSVLGALEAGEDAAPRVEQLQVEIP